MHNYCRFFSGFVINLHSSYTKNRKCLLFFCEIIIVVALIIRTVVVYALQKTVHLVLVQIDQTGVVAAFLVIYIIYTFVTVCRQSSLSFHVFIRSTPIRRYIQTQPYRRLTAHTILPTSAERSRLRGTSSRFRSRIRTRKQSLYRERKRRRTSLCSQRVVYGLSLIHI